MILVFCMSILQGIFVNTYEVKAADRYPMACSVYEVDTISASSEFVKQGCYDTFAAAKKGMTEAGNDAVVRHKSSLSPTKIIAMTRGILYSYPQRSNSVTLTIKQYNGTKSTYMIKHRELAYFGTESYDGSGNGEVRGTIAGFPGVVKLKDVDLVPYKFIENGKGIWLGGNDATSQNEQPFFVYVKQNYFTAEQNGNYRDLMMYVFSGWASDSTDNVPVTKDRVAVGPAPDWMETGQKYYSYNFYEFYTDRYFTNKAGTHHSYYMYLPLRTRSSVTAEQFDSYLKKRGIVSTSVMYGEGGSFIRSGETYGMNAMLVYAQACIESGFGRSNFAMNRKNLFGWGAVDSNPGQAAYYDSVEEGVKVHMGVQLRGYLYTPDYRFFGSHFGHKGSGIGVEYASDPYYGAVIAGICYAIDKNLNNYSGKLTEYNKYALGVVNEFDTYFYDKINGTQVYSARYGKTYQQSHTVVLLGEKDGWYKVQSTNYLNGSELVAVSKTVAPMKYNWDTNVVWIPKEKITRINDVAVKDLSDKPTPTPSATAEPTPSASAEPSPSASAEPTPTASAEPTPTAVPAAKAMYRVYNPNTGEHFYTAKKAEKDALVSYGWQYEGIGWYAPAKSETPVYRLYNSIGGEHHYTVKKKERDALVEAGWTAEGTGWYSDDEKTVPIYREFNPNEYSCNHNYTSSKKEHDALIELGWVDEGIGWYGVKKPEKKQ